MRMGRWDWVSWGRWFVRITRPLEHGDWLRGLLAGLERDGLVVVRGEGVGLPE